MTNKISSLRNKRVLITSGPTWVVIDDVRVISNISTGQLGASLAREFSDAGANVTLLQGVVSHDVDLKNIKVINFRYFDELEENLKKILKKRFDVVIHAAAVSDYKLKKSFKGKLASSSVKLKLELVRTPKLINQIKKINPKVFLVGFKLEPNLNQQTAVLKSKKLFQEAQCDLVVANSLNKDQYKGFILNKQQVLKVVKSRRQLSENLVKEVSRLL